MDEDAENDCIPVQKPTPQSATTEDAGTILKLEISSPVADALVSVVPGTNLLPENKLCDKCHQRQRAALFRKRDPTKIGDVCAFCRFKIRVKQQTLGCGKHLPEDEKLDVKEDLLEELQDWLQAMSSINIDVSADERQTIKAAVTEHPLFSPGSDGQVLPQSPVAHGLDTSQHSFAATVAHASPSRDEMKRMGTARSAAIVAYEQQVLREKAAQARRSYATYDKRDEQQIIEVGISPSSDGPKANEQPAVDGTFDAFQETGSRVCSPEPSPPPDQDVAAVPYQVADSVDAGSDTPLDEMEDTCADPRAISPDTVDIPSESDEVTDSINVISERPLDTGDAHKDPRAVTPDLSDTAIVSDGITNSSNPSSDKPADDVVHQDSFVKAADDQYAAPQSTAKLSVLAEGDGLEANTDIGPLRGLVESHAEGSLASEQTNTQAVQYQDKLEAVEGPDEPSDEAIATKASSPVSETAPHTELLSQPLSPSPQPRPSQDNAAVDPLPRSPGMNNPTSPCTGTADSLKRKLITNARASRGTKRRKYATIPNSEATLTRMVTACSACSEERLHATSAPGSHTTLPNTNHIKHEAPPAPPPSRTTSYNTTSPNLLPSLQAITQALTEAQTLLPRDEYEALERRVGGAYFRNGEKVVAMVREVLRVCDGWIGL